MKLKRTLLSAAILLLTIIEIALSHGGRTDRYGGHKNRKTGGYHYHNTGHVHNSSNPYQNHKTCGICSNSSNNSNNSNDSNTKKNETDIIQIDIVKALQAGLKCMGYDVGEIDGLLGKRTRKAVNQFIKKQKIEQ